MLSKQPNLRINKCRPLTVNLITTFSTYMTGEMSAEFDKYSILDKMYQHVSDGGNVDSDAFDTGIKRQKHRVLCYINFLAPFPNF